MSGNVKKSSRVIAGNVQLAEQCVWMPLIDTNALIKICLKAGKVEFVGMIPKDDMDYQVNFQVVSYEGKLVFVPWNTVYIVIYDIKNEQFRYQLIWKELTKKHGRFRAGIAEHEKLYLVSEDANEILEFNMETEKVVEQFLFKDKVEDFFSTVRPIKIDSAIWKISEKKGLSWKFDLITKEFEKIDIFNSDKKMLAGCGLSRSVWLVSEELIIYQIYSDLTIEKTYDIGYIVEGANLEPETVQCSFLGEVLYIIFRKNNSIIKIPLEKQVLVLEKTQILRFNDVYFSVEENRITFIEKNKITSIDNTGERVIELWGMEDTMLSVMEEKKGELLIETAHSYGVEELVQYITKKDEQTRKDGVATKCETGLLIHGLV